MGELIWPLGLTQEHLLAIKKLEETCCRVESLSMKLNWDMLNTRPVNQRNDLLCYDRNQLIGYLGLYAMSEAAKEVEITGMVHPDYRRKGLFTNLYTSALKECENRGVEKILLIAEKASDTGMGFAKSTGAEYTCSEYRMRNEMAVVPDFKSSDITLRKALSADYPDLIKLDAAAFHDDEAVAEDAAINAYRTTLVAELDGVFIGKIGLLLEEGDGYIFGFVIKPEYRGRGYGREVLSRALLRFQSEQVKRVCLEVAVKNENALMLYKNCGFEEITVYNYFSKDLNKRE